MPGKYIEIEMQTLRSYKIALFYALKHLHLPYVLFNVVFDYLYVNISRWSIRDQVNSWCQSSILMPPTNLHLRQLLLSGHISYWETCCITNMRKLFEDKYMFNEDISRWDVSSVFDMKKMFHNCRSFNQPLDDWDVRNVQSMTEMFSSASSFNQPLSSWDVRNVQSMRSMFYWANMFNQSLDSWMLSSNTETTNMFGFTEKIKLNPSSLPKVHTPTGEIVDLLTWSKDKKHSYK